MNDPSSLGELRAVADQAMGPVIGGFESVALVGFPDHSNVGDSAIWLGELALLKAKSVDVAYSCSSESYRKENLARHTDGDTPVLIHGGGYFGDIWPTGLDFMLQMVEDFPDRSIVVMPQTIHFESERQRERARRVIGGHPNVTICVRDHLSERLARKYFDHPVVLTPDSAIFLDLPAASPGSGILYLAREDREARADREVVVADGVTRMDWVELPASRMPARAYPSFLHRTKTRAHARIRISDSARWQESTAAEVRNALAHYRMRRGVRLIGSAEVIATDRLHGHILSLMMGQPHVLLDNSYGKVHAYYETWSDGFPLVHWASNPDRALALARTIRLELPSQARGLGG